ncbi:glycosyltransferase [Actimicrobium sp. CCC2.4]|uniref:glycosyltransferase family 4 protein n=1 Tax=Actimicrobium sp. CCC2.4 TaxID=3048606 RepID=UPI002AC98E1C|nr:glycosyltransferase [Actimicrobium sp. CCC2.4]MEB0136048.1 glycosyltransferase [Actimicrobium sp. CCC2.4]WPX32194.1 glycosyltransferase [Actimicrobium sp. CCC2.4]
MARSTWLLIQEHPSPEKLFALPNGIYFLLKFRQDLKSYGYATLDERLTLYFWWSAFGYKEYPDFTWKLRSQDKAYIDNSTPYELTSLHSSSIELWLRSNVEGLLANNPGLMDCLMAPVNFKTLPEFPIPQFLLLILRARTDLELSFDQSTFEGRLGLITWWDKHGKNTYTRIFWSASDWLKTVTGISSEMLFAVPLGIRLLLKYRLNPSEFECNCIEDRLGIYIWWCSLGYKEYPDLYWDPRSQDQAYLKNVNYEDFYSLHSKSIEFWLRSCGKDFFLDNACLLSFLTEQADIQDSLEFPVPRFILLLYKNRSDLREIFDISSYDGWTGLLDWWDQHGQLAYKKIRWSAQAWLHSYETDSESTLFAVPRRFKYLVRTRPETVKFDIQSPYGRLDLYFWWKSLGATQYPALFWKLRSQDVEFLNKIESSELSKHCAVGLIFWLCSPTGNELDKKSGWTDYLLDNSETGSHCVLPVPRFLLTIVDSRSDLQKAFDLTCLNGVLALLEWWTIHGQGTYVRVQWSVDSLLKTLCTPYIWEISGEQKSLPLFIFLIWRDRPDLQSTIDLVSHDSSIQLISWWNLHGKMEYPLFSCFEIEHASQNHGTSSYIAKVVRRNTTLPGVNIVGFPQGVLGLGEDARMAAQALELASIPCALINAPINGPQRVDNSMNHLITDVIKYPVTLFCLPPTEMMRLPLEGGIHLIDSAVYKIGAWPWELPHWPAPFSRVRQFVDEIWAQSDYVRSAFSRNSDTPVFKMPMAVSLPVVTENTRKRFGLHEDHFLFYILFDGKSWLSRKNPLAGIQAFQLAFSKKDAPVGLVVKAMNIVESDPIWQKIVAIAKADKRISILTELLPRQDAINLMASCDCYISLHRSEGFGRVIAEAMLIGQPVIVTNFSGNIDYCESETSFLVDGVLVPLQPGEYLFHEGQYWCDPDVYVAAEKISLVFENVTLRERTAYAGQQRIISDYSISTVAAAYSARLREIGIMGSLQ